MRLIMWKTCRDGRLTWQVWQISGNHRARAADVRFSLDFSGDSSRAAPDDAERRCKNYCMLTISIATGATPQPTMPRATAAACDRSIPFPSPNGPRSINPHDDTPVTIKPAHPHQRVEWQGPVRGGHLFLMVDFAAGRPPYRAANTVAVPRSDFAVPDAPGKSIEAGAALAANSKRQLSATTIAFIASASSAGARDMQIISRRAKLFKTLGCSVRLQGDRGKIYVGQIANLRRVGYPPATPETAHEGADYNRRPASRSGFLAVGKPIAKWIGREASPTLISFRIPRPGRLRPRYCCRGTICVRPRT
jgi:hypothetical protein